MDCPERQHLFDSYYDLVSQQFKLMQSPRLDSDRVRELARITETARDALERHEREHGCG